VFFFREKIKIMVYLTRKEHFNAAHILRNPNWSDEKNNEIFGKCANKNYHGHNYDLYVTVKGVPNPDTGFIMNAKELSVIIKKEVLDIFDHRNLSVDVEATKNIMPSTENLCVVIWNLLIPHITEANLHRIKLYETETIYAEYFGE
jgi:6-pyruvoyltetrahydropterin/6-carboxytetrahydropterin synthase